MVNWFLKIFATCENIDLVSAVQMDRPLDDARYYCRSAHAATAIEYCCFCNFCSLEEQNLVVCRANTLEVYVVHDEGRKRAAKMDLRASFPLFGDLAGVQRIRRYNAPDLIAISVLDAKICVVQWDSDKYELKTEIGFTFENVEPSDPLLAAPNTILAPHVGGVTEQAMRETALQCAAQILDVLAGRRPPHLVQPDFWERRRGA